MMNNLKGNRYNIYVCSKLVNLCRLDTVLTNNASTESFDNLPKTQQNLIREEVQELDIFVW